MSYPSRQNGVGGAEFFVARPSERDRFGMVTTVRYIPRSRELGAPQQCDYDQEGEDLLA